jgi:hypothetical protein
LENERLASKVGKMLKRNNSVPEEIDLLPEIQMRRKENSKEEQNSKRGSSSNCLEESLKKYVK